MMPQVFIDMDGVLFDIFTHYEANFGVRCSKELDNVDWDKVRSVPGFYRNMPLMADWRPLWSYVSTLVRSPIILTGIPKSIPEAEADKRAAVLEKLGDIEVIACASKDKCLVLKDYPGAVLIDDWEKHKDKWIAAGGKWITHTSATSSVRQLWEMGIGL